MSVHEKKIKNLVLPPQVNGKSYGFFELSVEKIRWTTTKKFSEVEIKLNWWGESDGISFKFNSVNSQAHSIRYQINTNYRLLQSYLTHCEPISVQIFSIKNKDTVGRVCIGIPSKLHNLEDPVGCVRGVFPILSWRNFKIGEMTVNFGVTFNTDRVISIKTLPEKENAKKVTFSLNDRPLRKVLTSSNKENIVVVGVKKPLSVRKPKLSTLNSKIFKPINQNATARRSSQDSSISEAKTSSDSTVSSTATKSIIDSHDNFMMDSIKIAVNSLELNFVGQSEVHNFIDKLRNRKSIVKCAVTSKLIKVQQADDSNFISFVFDTASKSEYFQVFFSHH